MEIILKNKIVLTIFIFFVFGTLIYVFFISPPNNFPKGTIENIAEGTSLRKLSRQLKNDKIIRSRIAFESFVILSHREKKIKPGDYLFDIKISAYNVARRIGKGRYNLAPIKITVPEGFNTEQMSKLFEKKMNNFNLNNFLLKAKNKEGYLFPDTYFFLTTDTEDQAIKYMSDNYEKKIEPLRPSIVGSGKTEKEIIIMASIIEEEAKGDIDRGIISGILWRRIAIGMPLQADAAPITYKIKGLPDSPISSPGLESIKSAISPTNSPYLFYLHDKEGNIHYAKTFSEHKTNKLKYLK